MTERRFYRASEVEKVEIDWMWDPYIARGKVTLLHGEKEIGKTLLAMKLMASCTSRVHMAPYDGYIQRCKCLYLTDEEKLSASVRPKLEESGANLKDILIVKDRLPLSFTDDSIKDLIKEHNIGLLVIDPLSAYLQPGDKLFDSPREVIPIIRMLEDIAAQTGCAIVLVEESDGLNGQLSKLWRLEFGNHVSSYLCLEWEKDSDYDERVLYHEYSQLSLEGETVNYVLTPGRGMKCER